MKILVFVLICLLFLICIVLCYVVCIYGNHEVLLLQVEQLHRIFRLCGTPSEEYWRKLKLSTTFRPPKSYRPSLVETFKDLPPSSLGLLCTLLALDPSFRGSASKALKNQVSEDNNGYY